MLLYHKQFWMSTQKAELRKEVFIVQSNELKPVAVSVAKAAEMLGVSRPTLYALIHTDGFPSFKVGSRTLVSTEGLAEWVRRQTQPIMGNA